MIENEKTLLKNLTTII